jgi:hypothetical protein
MKYLLFSLAFLVCLPSFSQPINKKYRIALPDAWKNNRSLLNHLDNIAPEIFTTIKGMQMCLDCNAPYTLMFFYDSVEVESRLPVPKGSSAATGNSPGFSASTQSLYECQTFYHFRGSWVLFNRDSIALSELLLVSPRESLIKINKFSIAQYIPPDYSLGEKNWRSNPNDNPIQFIERNKDRFVPTAEDILAVLEGKLWQLSR